MYALREMWEVEPRGSRPRWPRLVREVGVETATGAERAAGAVPDLRDDPHSDPDDELHLLGDFPHQPGPKGP